MKNRRKVFCCAPGEPVPVRVESTPAEGILDVRFLGPISGILTHWTLKGTVKGSGRSLACPGVENCPTATHRGATRWKGYAAAEYWRDGQYQDWPACAFEVTQHAYDLLEGSDLRGTIWRFRRQVGQGGEREVTAEMIGEVNPDYLRDAFSVQAAVEKCYGTIHIAFDVPPQMKRTLVMPASAGSPPPNRPTKGQPAPSSSGLSEQRYKQQLLDGTLPPEVRQYMPKLVARLEEEIASAGEAPGKAALPSAGRRKTGPSGQ